MFRIYYTDLANPPTLWATFDSEDFATIVVDAGNEFYAGEREFYFEDSAADEESDNDIFTEAYNEGIARDFEREEAQAYNRELSILNNVRI